ncbi:MAG: flagellar basal body P-ring formation chaperone FlgA [Sedimenticola sp.]
MAKAASVRQTATSLGWLILLWSVVYTPLYAGNTQHHATIRQAAESYIYDQLSDSDGNLTATAGELDRRLKLSTCEQPLEVFFSSNRQGSARKTVGVRCTDDSGWTIYLPVTISLVKEVVVAARELSKKSTLTPADLRMELRDVAKLSKGYFKEIRRALNKQLRRTLHAADVVTPSMLTTSKTIKRGNRVTILAQAGGIEVRVSGKALSDGATGDQIRVLNNSSKRKLEATVVGAGLVRVTL